MKRFCMILASLLLCAASCQKSGPENPTPVNPTPEPPVQKNYFKADIKDVYAYNCGESGTEVQYTTDISGWTITPSETWCTITVESQRFVIHVGEYKPTVNPDGGGGYLYTEPRKCTVQLVAGTALNKTFTVVQESMTVISAPSTPVTINAAGASKDVFIQNNCYGWTASTDATWLTLKQKDASTLTIVSSTRSSGATPRQATVNIVSKLDDWVKAQFIVADADAEFNGEDYKYGDHTNWD